MEIHRTKEPAVAAGKRLADAIMEAKGRNVLLLLSGGSAFAVLDHVATDSFGPQVSVTMLDERHSTDETVNNFAQLKKTDFYARAKEAGCNFISTETQEGNDLAHEAAFSQYKIKQWRDENPEGRIIALLGIGEDGHIAGIMPHPESLGRFLELFDGEHIAVGYDASGKNPYPERITVTNAFLRDFVYEAVVYAVGESKRAALERILESTERVHEVPARIIYGMKRVSIYTDVEV